MLSPEAKKLGKQPAYPQTGVHGKGITIRQLIMKDVLCAVISKEVVNPNPEYVATQADTLLEEMVKES